MNKEALPAINNVDFFFQVLDRGSRKRLIEDLKKGHTLNVPDFGGEYSNTVKKFKWSDISEKEKTFVEFWYKSNIDPPHVLFIYDEKNHEYKKIEDADIETKAKMILDPSAFSNYVKNLKLEPINKVRERFNKIRSIDEAVNYVKSGQQDKDMMRLEMETGKIEDKNKPGEYLIDIDPDYSRKVYGPKNVINFYEKDLHVTGKQAKLVKFNNKAAAATILKSVTAKLRGFNQYACVLDEVSYFLGIEPRSKISSKLYELSYKLPVDKCASQIKKLKAIAVQIQHKI